MGEAKQKSRRRAEVLAGEESCIYCKNKPDTVEHMPPIAMFRGRRRLSGFEYASCALCNNSTRAADAAAAFLCRLTPSHRLDLVELEEAKKLLRTLDQLAPGFRKELFVDSNPRPVWQKGRGSELFGSMQRIELSGPLTAELMRVFGAKLGMALFREKVGRPLKTGGAVFSKYYFNAGLSHEEAHKTLSIMPIFGELKMGKNRSGNAFSFRYNCDEKSLFAGLVGFSDNLFFRIFSSDDSRYLDALGKFEDHARTDMGALRQTASLWQPTST